MTTDELKQLAELLGKFTGEVSGQWRAEKCHDVNEYVKQEISARES